jgi:hypothetical protein
MIEEVGHAVTNLLDQMCCIMIHSTTFPGNSLFCLVPAQLSLEFLDSKAESADILGTCGRPIRFCSVASLYLCCKVCILSLLPL